MTSPFTITPTPPTSLKLEAGKEGTFSFTINSLEAPDKVQEVMLQALVVGADEKTREVDWLTPGPARNLSITGGKTETVTIVAKPTSTTPKGEHNIKLAVALKDHPNDTFGYSPPVLCEIAGPPVKPPAPGLPKWLIPVIAGAVVVLGVGIFLVIKFTGGGGDKPALKLGDACVAATPKACGEVMVCGPSSTCVLPAGQACTQGTDCISGECADKLKVCTVALGAACEPGNKDTIPCPAQSSCNPTSKLCLGAVGSKCAGDAQCETGKCTGGTCALQAPAVKPGDPCESSCPAPLTCGPTKRCVEQTGRPCEANNQCLTGLCEGSRCTEPVPPRNCTADGICGADQKCLEVQPGIKRCGWNPGHACNSNALCTSQWCNGGACSRDDGKCDSQADCPSPYVCIAAKKKCLLPNNATCGGHSDCDSTFCDPDFNRCAKSPCGECRPLSFCNQDKRAPACIPIGIIKKGTVIETTLPKRFVLPGVK